MSEVVIINWLKSQGVNVNNVEISRAAYSVNDYEGLICRMRGKHVLICDFSYPVEVFERMIQATEGNILSTRSS